MLLLRQRSSVQDNSTNFDSHTIDNTIVERIDNSFIEKAIISLWMIDIRNLVTNKVQLAKNFHIQPSEIDKMPMWEYEMFMKILNEIVDEDNKKQEKDMDKYEINKYKKMTNPSNMNKMMNPKMPSMPNINISTPKF